jgi:hypothetical protein
MADVFISYASEDRDRARSVADALSARGWGMWDRQIPLGKSFDEVIEQQIAAAKCVIVLWSAISVAKEWVRSETAEGKRRGILLPVFIESVTAPLQFRSLNGADLSDWQGESTHPEFQRLSARVAELIGNPMGPAGETLHPSVYYQPTQPRKNLSNMLRSPATLAGAAVVVIGLASAAYFFENESRHDDRPDNPPLEATSTTKEDTPPPRDISDMEKAIKDMAGAFSGAIPATTLAKGFHVPSLGVRVAYISPEQSAATLGSMPSGAVVMEVESGRPVAKAGVQVGDVILTIAGKKVASENDLRQAIFKIGPGKTEYSYRRGGESKTVAIDCPSCIAE